MEFKGNLENFTLDSIMNLFKLQQRSGFLTINRMDETAVLYFENGTLTGAICNELNGEDVLHYIVSWNSGEFDLKERLITNVNNISEDPIAVLEEGMRRFFVYSLLHSIKIDQNTEEK